MSTLRDAYTGPEAALDLPHVYHTRDAHNLQHAVVVGGFAEGVLPLRPPGVGPRAPAATVHKGGGEKRSATVWSFGAHHIVT